MYGISISRPSRPELDSRCPGSRSRFLNVGHSAGGSPWLSISSPEPLSDTPSILSCRLQSRSRHFSAVPSGLAALRPSTSSPTRANSSGVAASELVQASRNQAALRSDRSAREHRHRRTLHPIDEAGVHAVLARSDVAGSDAARALLVCDLVQYGEAAHGARWENTSRSLRGPTGASTPIRAATEVATRSASPQGRWRQDPARGELHREPEASARHRASSRCLTG